MSTDISLDGDNVVVKWTGRKGRGSLFHLAAEGNAKLVNVLDECELWAVLLAAKHQAFPLGRGRFVYETFLKALRETPEKVFPDGFPETPLGKLRLGVVHKAGGGMNAPHDSYLQIAADIKEGKEFVHHY